LNFYPAAITLGSGQDGNFFLGWLKALPEKPTLRQAFGGFAHYLGRVISYRALSLTREQYLKIRELNTIFPTGRLRADENTVNGIVEKYGVHHVAYARLYIGLHLVELDPSLSLHDDPETAVTIAGGYLDDQRKVYIFGVDVPKIEHLGYILEELQDDHHVWFEHRGVWFNSTWERTERYCLWEIPFLTSRLKFLRILHNNEELTAFITPFLLQMKAVRELDLKGLPYEIPKGNYKN